MTLEEIPEDLRLHRTPPISMTHSADIGNLVGALAKAQLDFKPIAKDSKNPFFGNKYADLASVISATQRALAENGLAVIQLPSANLEEQTQTLTTMLAHSSGQWIRGEITVPATMMLKDKSVRFDTQSIGSAMTYCRRYCYQAIIGVTAEIDDDGAAATGNKKGEESNEEFDQRTEGQRIITPFQATAIWDACKRSKKSNEEISAELNKYGVVQVEQLMRNDFQPFLKWANNIGENLQMALDKSVKEAPSSKASVAMKAVFAMAGKKGIPEVDVKRWCYETYGVESMTHLTSDQLGGALEWLKSVQ